MYNLVTKNVYDCQRLSGKKENRSIKFVFSPCWGHFSIEFSVMSVQENNQELLTDSDGTKQCRICFDDENASELISPCLCSGGSAFVHRQCLNRWRAENINGRGFKICNVCQFEYVIEPVPVDPDAERQRLLKYYSFVIRDSTALFMFIQFIILSVGFLLKFIDKNRQFIKNLYPDSTNEFLIYYSSSIILLLAIVGAITLLLFFCIASTRNTSSSNTRGSRGSSGTSRLFTGVMAIIIVCALVGFIVGLICSIVFLQKITKHHARKLWLLQEAEKFIVRDFQDCQSELESYRRHIVV